MNEKAVRSARRNKNAAVVLFCLAVPIQAYGLLSQGRISFLWIGLTIAAVTTFVKTDRTIKADEAQKARPVAPPQTLPPNDFFWQSN